MIKFLLISSLLFIGCSSKHKMNNLSYDFKESDKFSFDQSIGLNSKEEAVIVTKKTMARELKDQVWQNHHDQMNLTVLRGDYRSCRKDVLDPRLSGNDSLIAEKVPSFESKISVEKREYIGLEDDNIMLVKEEYLLDRLNAERKLGTDISAELETLKKLTENCKDTLGILRMRAGLRKESKILDVKITPDGKISEVLQKKETLDDEFEEAE